MGITAVVLRFSPGGSVRVSTPGRKSAKRSDKVSKAAEVVSS